jgi:hypothetical protein|tara:strand:+ start:254 stop:829 length:576 start_codon:yes stop_codon:yes gene_type:complete
MAQLKNYHTIRYGTAEGELKFGGISSDNVLSAVMLRNGGSLNHYITLDATGKDHRKHGTICRSPGSFQIEAGDNVTGDNAGVFIDAVSGDLILRAASGRVKIEGVNIQLVATGSDGNTGNVEITANEKVIVKSQIIDLSSKVSTKIFSEKTVDVIGKAILDIYGGFVDVADGATSVKRSLGESINEEKNNA